MIKKANKKNLAGRFLVAGFFVLVISLSFTMTSPVKALTNTYDKVAGSQLTPQEWNNLLLDFLSTDGGQVIGATVFDQPIVVGTPQLDTHAATVSFVNSVIGGGVTVGSLGQTLRHNGTNWEANSTLFNDGTNIGIGLTNPTANLHVNGSSIFTGTADFRGSVAINTNPDNNASGFEYGNGYNPLNTDYFNERFRVNSFFESPHVSMGVARNYLLQTEVFDNAVWVKTSIGTVTANSQTAPHGFLTAENIPAGSIDTANISQTITNNVTGYWTAGVWARAQVGTTTIALRIDSSAETGSEKIIELDTQWRFYSITQNLTSAHTTKTFRVISGANAISLWGARMNPGQVVNAYNVRTTSALTTATPGTFFNNGTVYATTFSGSLSGNASTATSAGYSNYGSYNGFSLSNATNKSSQWAYIGEIYLAYNSTYRYGQSWNVELKIKEISNNGGKAYNLFEDAQLILRGKMASVADANVFNTTVPDFSVELNGNNLDITKDDVAMLVYSAGTVNKYVRLYVRLKNPNTHYSFVPVNRYGASYNSAGTISISYCYFNNATNQVPVAALPAPVQGSIVYGADGTNTNFWRLLGDNIFNWNSGNVGIGTSTPTNKLQVDGGTGQVINASGGYIGGLNSTPLNADHAVPLGYLENNYAPIGTGVGAAYVQGGNSYGTTATLGTNDNNLLNIETNNSVRMTVATNGNVGIGTTGPGYKLHVKDDSGAVFAAVFEKTDANASVRIQHNSDGTNPAFGSAPNLELRNSNSTANSVNSLRFTSGLTSGGVQIGAQYPSANNGEFFIATQDSVAGSGERFRITSDGNVGIGTTGPNARLEVMTGTAADGDQIRLNPTTRSIDIVDRYSSSDFSAKIWADWPATGLLYFGVNSAAGAPSTVVPTLTIRNNSGSGTIGNVGIGITAPTNKLHIDGGTGQVVSVSGGHIGGLNSTPVNADQAVPLGYLESNYAPIGTGVGSAYVQGGNSFGTTATLGTNDNNLLNIETNNAVRMTVATNGNVGIGTTNPGKTLDVAGDVMISRDSSLWMKMAEGAYRNLIGFNDVSDTVELGENTGYFLGMSFSVHDAPNAMYIKNTSGNVGIGTTNPGGKLEVAGSNAAVKISDSISRNPSLELLRGSSVFGNDVYYDWKIANNSGNLLFSSGSTSGYIGDILTLHNTGNVGIGTTTPANKLHVSGGTGQVVSVTGGHIGGLNSTPVNADQAVPLGYLESNYAPIGTGVGAAYVQGGNSFGTTATLGTNDNNLLNIETNNAVRMTVAAGGNVGIGTTAPGVQLELRNQTLNNTPFQNLQTIFANVSSESSGESFTATNASFGLSFRRNWSGGVDSSNVAGIYGFSSANYRGGMVFRTKNNTSAVGDTDINAMVISPAGNVGIGTITPVAKLDVYGGSIRLSSSNAAYNTEIINAVDSANAFRIQQNGGDILHAKSGGGYNGITLGTGNASLVLERSNSRSYFPAGNVGIGITAPTNKLHVDGGTGQVVSVAGGHIGGLNSTPVNADQAVPLGYLQANYSPSVSGWQLTGNSVANDNAFLGSTSNYDVAFRTNNTERMRILKDGNVGIGTTAPASKLQIDSSDGTALRIQTGVVTIGQTANLEFGISSNDGLTSGKISSIRTDVGGANSADLAFYTSLGVTSNERMRILANGNVGIGTTAPDYKLQIAGNVSIGDNAVGLSNPRLVLNTTSFRWFTQGLNGNYQISQDGGAGNVLTILPTTGNVGIGTTTPANKLHVYGGTGQVVSVSGGHIGGLNSTPVNADQAVPLGYLESNYAPTGTGVGSAFVQGGNSYGAIATLGTNDNNILNIETNNAVRMTVATNGNVGVGITAPNKTLQVMGGLAVDSGFNTGVASLYLSHTGASNQHKAGIFTTYTSGFGRSSSMQFAMNNVMDGSIVTTADAKMTILEGGNVGINTTNPGDKLDVLGNIAASGSLKISSSTLNSFIAGNLGIGNLSAGASKFSVFGNSSIGTGYFSNAAPANGLIVEGRVGIGITNPAEALHVVGNTQISGGLTLGGDLSMPGRTLTVNKITANTIDPLYKIKGVNYSTFASSIAGGVKEEYVGRIAANQFKKKTINNQIVYETNINFDYQEEGSDLWVWYKTIDFSSNNVEVFVTPLNNFAEIYAVIKDNSIIIRSNQPVDASLRLVGKRFDWQAWPTRALDQNEPAGMIIN